MVSRYGSNILNRRIMATLFYEPSTRTRLSFEAAMYRLGRRGDYDGECAGVFFGGKG